ncbi:flagellar motor protein MotA [Psychrosphaera saromensis]|uniref:Flagellar motor protein MotA n=1 Tax=Psychrosphaera saromensis TaxID=716813 RepID=A0A2S7V0I5_9GAMM|nr:MotA/TolQ/ExbB proton channel family protein [Psychrosphaera saromensis]PQJ55040.1 flagellar motor protein MotA [Psychrosphaera saromensis]GHB78283.1 flagellar motor protein MotA [Psychrosphaera saromensis]GLQ13663.1 flagellar motor protein MotA [Psychrosphaera saromensis]
MKQVLNSLVLAAALVATSFNVSAAGELDKLLDQVKKDRISEGQLNKKREKEFLAAKADKQALLNKAKKELKDEKARGDRLQKQYAQNDLTLIKRATELKNAQGTLGEMFGVVRRAASNTIGSITASNISGQPGYGDRSALLAELAEAKKLPTTKELEDLWIALQTEMTESAKVVVFDAEVAQLAGGSVTKKVTRVGSFNLIAEDEYLIYNSDVGKIQPLGKAADGYYVSSANALQEASAGELVPFYVDPSRGGILRLNTQRATLSDRYHQGGTPGYVITVVLFLGLFIAAFSLYTTLTESTKMKAQLKDTDNPSDDNALGRILKIYQENKTTDVENLELKLDEAILRETPRIDRGINTIKILAAVAPLLGLLGTVIGMIETFQQITLFGTGDPKLMAGSISMALVTTAMGIIAALPLIFVHSIVAARAKSIIHVLDEQSAGIIAAHAEKEKA